MTSVQVFLALLAWLSPVVVPEGGATPVAPAVSGPEESEAPGEAVPVLGSPREDRAGSSGDAPSPALESPTVVMAPRAPAAAASAPAYSAEIVVQMRFQQTEVLIPPGLTALVMQQYPSPSTANDALRMIRDSARSRDGLRPRRILVSLTGAPTDRFYGEVRLDFARLIYEDAVQVIRRAYAQYRALEKLTLVAGMFEIPFSLFEAVDDADVELAERGPTHELLHHLRFTERDLGTLVDLAPLRNREWLHLIAAVFDGGATGGQHTRGPGLVAGRLLSRPFPFLQIGAGLVWRPRSIDAWEEELRFRYQEYDRGVARGVDVTVSFPRIIVRAEWLSGDRTDNDVAIPLKERRGDARTFMAVWGMVAVRVPVRGIVIMPAARAEWLDTDREHSDLGGIVQFSVALNVDLSSRLRALVDVSRHYVQFGTRNWEFDRVRYDTDATVGAVQLQLRL